MFTFRNTKGHFYEKVGKKGEPICIDDELPFEIPDNWEIMRLDDIGVYKKGPFGSALKKSLFVPKSEDTIKVYEQKNAIQKNSTLGEYYLIKQKQVHHLGLEELISLPLLIEVLNFLSHQLS